MSHRDAGPTIAAQKSRKKCATKSRLNMMKNTQHTMLSLFLFQLQGRMWLVGKLTWLHNYYEATLFAWSCLTFKLPSISLKEQSLEVKKGKELQNMAEKEFVFDCNLEASRLK